MASVCVGDEFEVDSEGRLKLKLCGSPAEQTWPFACPTSENGLRVDPACGLWIPPRGRAALVSATGTSGLVNTVVPAAFTVVETASINVANPSTCWDAIAFRFINVDVDFDLPPGTDSRAAAMIGVNEFNTIENPAPAGGTEMSFNHWEHCQPLIGGAAIPAGGSMLFADDIAVGQGQGGARWREARWTVRVLVIAGLS